MRTTISFAIVLTFLLGLSVAHAHPTMRSLYARSRLAPAKTTLRKAHKTTKPRARRGTLVRKLKTKVLKTRRKLADWWRWQRKKDWKLVETHLADFNPRMQPSSLNPYSWNVWKDKRTGRTRTTTDF